MLLENVVEEYTDDLFESCIRTEECGTVDEAEAHRWDCEYTQPEENSCVYPNCPKNNKINSDGTCEECGEYKILSKDMYRCEDPVCDKPETQFINENGECFDCPPLKRASTDGLRCESDKCTDR